jgi:hypothetical protein
MKRRDFMKLSGVGAGLALIPVSNISFAEAPAMVSPEDAQAKALGYVEQSVTAGQTCANCVQAKGDLKAAHVGCNLFPGKEVKSAGWCKVWAARPQ